MTTLAPQTMERPPRQRGFVGPLVLIGLGIVLLMNTFGVWGWDVWGVLLRLWPLLLIAGGLDLLFGRRSLGAGLVVLVITVLMFAAGIWYLSSDLFAGTAFSTQTVSQDVGSAARADVTIAGSVGTLRLSESTDTSKLVSGEIDLLQNENVSEQFGLTGDTAVYHLETQADGSFTVWPFATRDMDKTWELQLNGEVPMDLSVSTGVGEAILDLQGLDLTEFSLNTGVGETTVTLPATGEYAASIKAGVGEVNIQIPDGLAARITVNTGLGGVDVASDFEREGDDTYVSPMWNGATNRVTLHVDAGVGSVNVIPVP